MSLKKAIKSDPYLCLAVKIKGVSHYGLPVYKVTINNQTWYFTSGTYNDFKTAAKAAMMTFTRRYLFTSRVLHKYFGEDIMQASLMVNWAQDGSYEPENVDAKLASYNGGINKLADDILQDFPDIDFIMQYTGTFDRLPMYKICYLDTTYYVRVIHIEDYYESYDRPGELSKMVYSKRFNCMLHT